jgi:antitoxin MazE
MKTTIRRWGNSLAVRIPKSHAEETAIGEGDEVDVRADDHRTVVERPRPRHYRLGELLAGVTKANRHDSADFGPRVGREAL